MQLEHSFSVPVGIDDAWPILIDIERIGPCMPGAAIDSVDGDEFTGTVKVKLGPINLTYKGKAAFIEKDEAARRAVIDARGRDARGNGTAAAKITATLHDDGSDSTTVKVITELDITGKPAQFGRGVMVDVGNKLLGQFADSLAKTIRGGEAQAPAVAAAPATADAAAHAAATAAPTDAAASARQTAPSGGGAEAAAPKRARPKPPTKGTAPAAGTGTEAAAESSAEAAAAAGEASAAPAPTEAATEAATEDTGDAGPEPVPAYAVPGGIPADDQAHFASVNGHVPSQPSRSHHDVEPIDLLHHAGPAVAKRLAPVALALLILLIVIRRRRARD